MANDRIEQLIVLGREHYNANEYDRAEPYLAEAATARPSFPDLYNMLGVIYHAQGRFQEAEEAFSTALKLNPRYTEAALNLSVTYNDRGKYDQAREVYTRAVSASVGQPNALDRFARGKLANMHADLGAAYAGLAMFDESVREYAKALDLCPEFADLRVRLGNVYRDMGVHEAAISEFEHAKRLRPDFVPARIHLGVTLFSLGRKDAALAEWQAVLDKDPANKRAQLYIRMVNDEHGPQPGSALPK
ncbi:MAG TPA: tetratricopeptide repeat protein [Kofleriaceae bacterium]|nr:tetratricopeptide repeat protein [Kofleriaceae bacterium]